MNKKLQKLSENELENISGGMSKVAKYTLIGIISTIALAIGIKELHGYMHNRKCEKKRFDVLGY